MNIIYFFINLFSEKHYKVLYGSSIKELIIISKQWKEEGWAVEFPITPTLFNKYRIVLVIYKLKKFNSKKVSFLYEKIKEMESEGWYVEKSINTKDNEWYYMTMNKDIII